MGDLSCTQNQGRYLSGQYKHATAVENPKTCWGLSDIRPNIKIDVSSLPITMATINLNTLDCFSTIPSANMRRKLAHQVHQEIYLDNQVSSDMRMSLNTLQEIYKINDEILGKIHDNFFNILPPKNGISSNLIPAAIILGSPNPYYNELKIIFVAYVQVCIGNTNSTKYIKLGTISLRPSNEQGGYYFMYLATGKYLHLYIWTELPINDQLLYWVNYLSTKYNQTEMTKGYPIFEWRSGIPIAYKDGDIQNEDNYIASTHEDRNDYDVN